jgi:hypothetical protein
MMRKPLIVTAIVAAALGVGMPAAHAYGNAPWCAVIDLGKGDAHWDCEYQTFAQCQPNVIAGNRGFCDVNPYGGVSAAPAFARPRHRRHAHR